MFKLTDMITLLANSLNSHQTGNPTISSSTPPVPPRTNQHQVSLPNDESVEVLSDVSDNLPTHPPAVRIMATGTSQRSTSDSPFTSTGTPTVSLPPVTARLREKIISGEFVDFNSLLSKAMFSGNQPPESTKSFTVQLTSRHNDLLVQPTQHSKKISSF